MTSLFFIAHILAPDTHANRPSTDVPDGALFPCDTHNTIEKYLGADAWDDWWVGSAGGTMPTGGSTGQILTKDSSSDYDTSWATLSGTRTINAQTGTTYTAVLTDADRAAFLTLSNASAIAFTVPPNSSVAFPVGSVIEFAQLGAGQVTITPGSGVTVNGTPGLKVAAQYGTAGLLKIATDVWLAYGRLAS